MTISCGVVSCVMVQPNSPKSSSLRPPPLFDGRRSRAISPHFPSNPLHADEEEAGHVYPGEGRGAFSLAVAE